MNKLNALAAIALSAVALLACDSDGPAAPGGPDIVGDGQSLQSCSQALTGTFENITIQAGEACTVRNATVNGNIKALKNAHLFVITSTVRGNIQGDEAAVVNVTGGTVDGDIQIVDGRSSGQLGASVIGTTVTGGNIQIEKMQTGSIVVSDARVLVGNIQVVENSTSDALSVENNHTGANMQVFKNTGAGSKQVRGNTIAQSLQCKENSIPFNAESNTAGDKEDQCA